MKSSEQQLFDTCYAQMVRDGKLLYVGRLLQQAADRYGQRVALIASDRTILYHELYHHAAYASQYIRQQGVKPRDRVIICMQNSVVFYVAYYAVWQAGAIVVPVNTFLKEVELGHIVTDAQPTLIIADQASKKLFQKSGVTLPPIITDADITFTHLDTTAAVVDEIIDQANPDDMVILLYTSGTTGVAKGVMLSSKNIITNICQSIARLGLTSHERVLGVLPFFHSFSQIVCMWASVFMGASVIIVPKIDRHAIGQNLKNHRPTIMVGVPPLYGLLCLMKTASLSSVRYFISGGDALPDKLRLFFALLYGRKICNGYGLTEASPVIAVEIEDMVEPTSCVGRPLIGIAVSIRDGDGVQVPDGSVGQLWVRGDNVMLGYYKHPEMTAAALHDGWLDTGDCAYLNARGKIVITGREKDLIIHKGINIYPQEIENVIMSNPQVVRAAVIGVQDELVGEYPIAYVQIKEATPNIEADLRQLCMNNLASYKVPRVFTCKVEELPLTATGKVDKKILRVHHTAA